MIRRQSPLANSAIDRLRPCRLRLLTAVLLAAAAAVSSSCQPRPAASPGSRVDQWQREPVIRIRIARGRRQITLASPSQLRVKIASRPGFAIDAPFDIAWSAADRWRIVTSDNETRFSAPSLTLTPASGESLRLDGVDYPGSVQLRGSPSTAGFDVINHVPMEQYLPGVLAGELYARWQPATFMAQAIAARSYAMVQMSRRRHRYFDLESTTASQVYHGVTGSAKARNAVRQSRGMVLTYDGNVLPAFYCSCTGGVGQDAAIAFPNAPDLPPLRGRTQGTWGQASAYYRWGPIQRDRAALAQRIAAWGYRHRHPIAALKGLRRVAVVRTNAAGRIAQLTIGDDLGQTFRLGPEAFRHACNHEPEGLRGLSRAQQLPSSQCTVIVSDRTVSFTNGRGFGHGVGMGQFGAEAMASAGHSAKAILAFYYPTAQLVKAY